MKLLEVLRVHPEKMEKILLEVANVHLQVKCPREVAIKARNRTLPLLVVPVVVAVKEVVVQRPANRHLVQVEMKPHNLLVNLVLIKQLNNT